MTSTRDVWLPRTVRSRIRANRWAVVVPEVSAPTQVLDLAIDDQRVLSFRTKDLPSVLGVGAVLVLPRSLRERLHGSPEVSVRYHDTGALVAAPRVIRAGPGETNLQDAGGRPLAVDKWGRLVATYEGDAAQARSRLLAHTREVTDLLTAGGGLPSFVVSGTLLGAVRDGTVLPHDDDADVGYLSSHENPVDVGCEQMRLERLLADHGYDVVRHSFGHLQLHFDYDGHFDHYVDVFTCWYIGEWFHQPFHIRAVVPRGSLVPLSSVTIDGVDLPAPRDPEPLLVANYGEGWRTPDPAHRFATPSGTQRRFRGWLGDMHGSREAWEAWHASQLVGRHEFGPPSTLARLAADDHVGSTHVLDVGCGAGDDVVFLARSGMTALGVDFSRPAVRLDSELLSTHERARFEVVNVNDPRETFGLAARLSTQWPVGVGSRLILSRDLLDQLRPHVLRDLMSFLALVTTAGDRVILTWRTAPKSGDIGFVSTGAATVVDLAEQAGLTVCRLETVRDDADRRRRRLVELRR